jgi:hypothetical protein
MPPPSSEAVEIDGLQAFPEADGVAHRRHAAIDRAGADRDQDPAMLAEFPEFLDVVLVRAAAFDEADIDRPIERLLVIEWRDVEIDEIDQFEDPLVDVEQRHVAAETAGQGAGRERGFCRFRH